MLGTGQLIERLEKFTYRPRVIINIETERFVIKTANSFFDLFKVLRFRKNVFLRSFKTDRGPLFLDYESFDLQSDHLMIIDRTTKQIVGTFRLICSLFSESFYSQSEFDIDWRSAGSEIKLELGRACVHPSYRTGAIIQHLWRGIVKYIVETESSYLIGCSSIKTMEPEKVAQLDCYFRSLNLEVQDAEIKPNFKHSWSAVEKNKINAAYCESLSLQQAEEVRELIPPLLAFYVRAGARICPRPAVDRELQCIDYFTILDLKRLDRTVARRYGLLSQMAVSDS